MIPICIDCSLEMGVLLNGAYLFRMAAHGPVTVSMVDIYQCSSCLMSTTVTNDRPLVVNDWDAVVAESEGKRAISFLNQKERDAYYRKGGKIVSIYNNSITFGLSDSASELYHRIRENNPVSYLVLHAQWHDAEELEERGLIQLKWIGKYRKASLVEKP